MKKAQDSASGAATLLVLIAVLVVLYILFIPANYRNELLNGDLENDTITTNGATYQLLMQKNVGLLKYVNSKVCDNNECEHNIPSFTLSTSSKSVTLLNLNPFIIKNNIFKKEFKKEFFDIDMLENIDNILITFGAKEYKGILKIVLNGKTIFEQKMDNYNVQPIEIKKEILKEHNSIEFYVSSVGAKFWQTNQYSIENFKIYSKFTDRTKEKGRQTFYINEDEYNSLDYGKLKFSPECNQAKVGNLIIKVNGRIVYDVIPDCGILNIIELSRKNFNKNENLIEFVGSEGTYLIDTASIKTYLKDVSYPSYYFDIDDEEWEDLKNNITDLNLTVEVSKSIEKEFDLILNVNGYKRTLRFENNENIVERNIETYLLKRKNNAIMLEPDNQEVAVSDMKLEIKVRGD